MKENGVTQEAVRPSGWGSLLFLGALFFTWSRLEGGDLMALCSLAALGTGVGIVLSLIFDFQRGWRNLVRSDIAAILALYFLTLFEFLFPQQEMLALVDGSYIHESLGYLFLAFAGLTIGRHLTSREHIERTPLFSATVKPSILTGLFVGCFLLGYLHMAVAVDFDFQDWWDAILEPRFFQPWTRGRLGNWKAMLTELGMLLYLLPPLMGVVLARIEKYPLGSLILMGLGTGITFFYGYSSGTRHIFCTYLVTFVIGYLFAVKRDQEKRIFLVAGLSLALLFVASQQMLHFREIGLGAYWRGELEEAPSSQSVYVDMNLFTLAQVVGYFPKVHDYLGWEIPYLALVRPIPRALWSGKPLGMSVTMEQVVGAGEDYTVAASFVGEAYMSGGWFGVLMTSLFFGSLMGWWNRFGCEENSDWGILIYASGFFSAVISMRSLFVFTTAILPTVAAIFIGYQLTDLIRSRMIRKSSFLRGNSSL